MKKYIKIALVVSVISSCQNLTPQKFNFDEANELEKVSYSIGINVATSIKSEGLDSINSFYISKGFQDVFENKDLAINIEESNKIIGEYFNKKQNSPYISIAFLISLSAVMLLMSMINVLHVPMFLLTGLLIISIGYFLIKNYYPTGDTLLISLTVAFGLIHGFGFGSFLMNTNFDTSQAIVSLLGFNLGVEIGQLVFVGLILLVYKLFSTLKLSKVITFSKDLFFIITLSMGMFWYVQRLLI